MAWTAQPTKVDNFLETFGRHQILLQENMRWQFC